MSDAALSSDSPATPERAGGVRRSSLAVGVLGLLGVGLAAAYAYDDARCRHREHLSRLNDQAHTAVLEALRGSQCLTDRVRSAIQATDPLGVAPFDDLVASLDLNGGFPAVGGVGFARVVPTADGRTETVIERYSPSGAEHLGRSVGSSEGWDAAARHALATGCDAIARTEEDSLVWLTPIFRPGSPLNDAEQRTAALKGWAFASVSLEQVVVDLNRRFAPAASLRVYDLPAGTEIGSQTGESRPMTRSPDGSGRYLELGGLAWQLAVAPRDSAFDRAERTAALVVLIGLGLVIAAAVLVQKQASVTERARLRASKMVEHLADNEQRLREAIKRTELILDSGGLGQWDWNIATGECVFDARYAEMFGESLDTIEQNVDWFRSRVHPDDVGTLFDSAREHTSDAEPRYHREFRIVHRDGSVRWISSVGRAVERDESGTPLRMVGVHVDVTDRVLAEQASAKESRRARELARLITESPNEVFIFNRKDLRFIEVNDGAVASSGYSRAALLQMTPVDLKPEFTEASFREAIEPLASASVSTLDFQATHQRRNGSTYPAGISLHEAVYDGKAVYVAFVTDLSERRRLEDQLAQAQKLESLGQLAAGIAHEINTPMQSVSNNVEFLSDCHERLFSVVETLLGTFDNPAKPWDERKADIYEMLESKYYKRISEEAPAALADAAAAARRVVEIVRAMRAMSHPGADEKVPTDLNDLIRSAVAITSNRWKYAAELELELDESLEAVPARAAEFSQVLLNLIVNAADAVVDKNGEHGAKGRITVRTKVEADWVRVEVGDTGVGIPEEIRHRLFEPFFTTKEVGRGTGQGLAITYDVVVNLHGGTIDVLSTEGEGTTFVVCLPLREETVEEAESPTADANA